MNFNAEQIEIKNYLITTIQFLLKAEGRYFNNSTNMFNHLISRYHTLGGTRLRLAKSRLEDDLEGYENEYKFWTYVCNKIGIGSRNLNQTTE